jgi:ABC-2 type transport system permease protein
MTRRSHFYWSVRRELWEHRSIFWVPLAVAGVALPAFLIHMARNSDARAIAALAPAKRAVAIAMPYSMVASMILLASFIVGLFFALDALHAERRDRSVLFWKSMPVSDAITVLAKAFVPFAVVPAVAFVIALAAQLAMMAASLPMLPIQGDELHLGQMTIVMAYGVAIHALWFLPIYGYLLLVSAWAPRAPLLWAVLPVFALAAAEKLALGSAFVLAVVRYRFMGAMAEGFDPSALKGPITQLSQLEPARFFASPNLWLGLAFAAAFLYAAVRLRRSREPN